MLNICKQIIILINQLIMLVPNNVVLINVYRLSNILYQSKFKEMFT